MLKKYNTEIYGKKYAESYLKHIRDPYTVRKNTFLTENIAKNITNHSDILDIGGNINALIKNIGLKDLLNEQCANLKKKITYTILDVDPIFFNRNYDLIPKENYPIEDFYLPEDITGIVGSAEAIPQPDEGKDAIIMADVLEHVENPLEAINEVSRVLKSKGIFFLILPAMYQLDQFEIDEIKKIQYSTHLHGFSENKILQMLEFNGFSLKEIKGIDYLTGIIFLLWMNPSFRPEKEKYYLFENLINLLNKISKSEIDLFLDENGNFLTNSIIKKGTIETLNIIVNKFGTNEEKQELQNILSSFSRHDIDSVNYLSLSFIKDLGDSKFLANSIYIHAEKNPS